MKSLNPLIGPARVMRILRLVMIVVLLPPLHAAGEGDAAGTNHMTEAVRIDGLVKNPRSFSVEELKEFPVTGFSDVPMRCSATREKGTAAYSGVLLKKVLDAAEVDVDEHHSRNRTYVVVTASDNYSVVFSWHELFNAETGEGVLLFYERNGAPLGDEEGRIALLSARDTFTCGRHVKWVQRVTVRRAEP